MLKSFRMNAVFQAVKQELGNQARETEQAANMSALENTTS